VEAQYSLWQPRPRYALNKSDRDKALARLEQGIKTGDVIKLRSNGNGDVFVLGVRHVSQVEQCKDIESLLGNLCPDTVAVELDLSRCGRDLTRFGMEIQQGREYDVRVHDPWPLGFTEFHAAINGAADSGAKLWLIDREDSWHRYIVGAENREFGLQFLHNIYKGIFTDVHDWDPSWFPLWTKHMMEEREANMTLALRNIPGRTVVAVVGKGHLSGISNNWSKPQSELLEKLPKTPPPRAHDVRDHMNRRRFVMACMCLPLLAAGGLTFHAGWSVIARLLPKPRAGPPPARFW